MNVADWVIVAIIAISCVISLWRGFVNEALSLVVWAGALFVALTFGDSVSAYLTDYIATPSLRRIASIALLFVVTLVVGSLLNSLIGAMVRMSGLGGTDRLLGTVFGAARGVILVVTILMFAPPLLSVDHDPWWQQSVLIPKFLMLEDWARDIGSTIFGWLSALLGLHSSK